MRLSTGCHFANLKRSHMFSITRTAKFLVPATASVALHKIYISKGKLEFTVLHEVRARLVQGINEGSLRNKYIE